MLEKLIKHNKDFKSAYAICVWFDGMRLAVSSWITKAYQWYDKRNKIKKNDGICRSNEQEVNWVDKQCASDIE